MASSSNWEPRSAVYRCSRSARLLGRMASGSRPDARMQAWIEDWLCLLSCHREAGVVASGPAEEEGAAFVSVREDERPDDGAQAPASRNSRRVAAGPGLPGFLGGLTALVHSWGTPLCRRRALFERLSVR